MHNNARLNPIDEICRKLSQAYLLADKNDPAAAQKYADSELDGLYEFAKIIFSISREKQFPPKTSQLLLEAVGLQVHYPASSDFDVDDGPHIFVANRCGCHLIDGAIGTILTSRLGIKHSLIVSESQHLNASANDMITVAHPRIQQSDPRSNSDIASQNAHSVMAMRAALAEGRSLLFFPGSGIFRSCRQGRLVLDGNFDRLAPVLMACKRLSPKLHLYHFDYQMPDWWTKLLHQDQAEFRTSQWKAVLGLQRQVAKVSHLKTLTIEPSIRRSQRFELCRKMLALSAKVSVESNRQRQPEAA